MHLNNRIVPSFVFLVLGILFVINGIHRNEHVTVENKSGIVCLECIGIG
jgi:hypothetical protein